MASSKKNDALSTTNHALSIKLRASLDQVKASNKKENNLKEGFTSLANAFFSLHTSATNQYQQRISTTQPISGTACDGAAIMSDWYTIGNDIIVSTQSVTKHHEG